MKEIRKKHNDAGERLLREAVAADPKYPAPLNDLGVVLMVKKNYQEAEKVLKQALETDPKSLHALLNLGITMNHQGDLAFGFVLAPTLAPNGFNAGVYRYSATNGRLSAVVVPFVTPLPGGGYATVSGRF